MLAAMLIEPSTIAHPIGAATMDGPRMHLPMGGARASLGFPSPADDFLDDAIDLNELVVRNPAATFYYRAEGWSMVMAGVCDGDILAVDRSVSPADGDLVIACWEGNQPTCKMLKVCSDHIELHSRNPHCPNIVLTPDTEVQVFAVVGVIRTMKRGNGRVRAD